MTFTERGLALKAYTVFEERRDSIITKSVIKQNNETDSWMDIDGGINLFANASLRRKLPMLLFTQGESIGLSKGGTFIGHHIMVPKEGVTVHINTFNFPVWGMLEKCAVNWLAGGCPQW